MWAAGRGRVCALTAALPLVSHFANAVAAAQAPAEPRAWAEARRLEGEAEDAMVRGDIATGASKYIEACQLQRAVDLREECPAEHPLLVGGGDRGFRRVGRLKLRHDSEQLEYLVALGRLPAKPYSHIASIFRQMIPKLPREHAAVDVSRGIHKLFDRAYNRALHLTLPGRLPVGQQMLNAEFDGSALERQFRESELPPEADGCEAQNGIAYVDGLLSEGALSRLHQWCLESTMWFASRPGYVAAFMQDAFAAPLAVQLAEELRRALPTVLGPHRLMNMWAFKYANNESDWPLEGTAVHADIAAVNVNLWITDDDANLDHNGGGLIVYTKQAPREWGFEDYNSKDQVPKIREHLQDSGRVTVPHRRNRVVIFNSNLFHETQAPRFRPGYANRRINLTFLFGRRCGSSGGANEGRASHRGRRRAAAAASAAEL